MARTLQNCACSGSAHRTPPRHSRAACPEPARRRSLPRLQALFVCFSVLAVLSHWLRNTHRQQTPMSSSHGPDAGAGSKRTAGTAFGERHFNEEERAIIQQKLSSPLGLDILADRVGPGGSKLTYIEGFRQIDLANEIFGFSNWSSTVTEITIDFMDEVSGRWSCGVSAIVRVTLQDGASHEDVGYGLAENQKSKAQALEMAKKTAVTDGRKRALRIFGPGLGNCVYDKQHVKDIHKPASKPVAPLPPGQSPQSAAMRASVSAPPIQPPSAAPALTSNYAVVAAAIGAPPASTATAGTMPTSGLVGLPASVAGAAVVTPQHLSPHRLEHQQQQQQQQHRHTASAMDTHASNGGPNGSSALELELDMLIAAADTAGGGLPL